MFLHPRPIVRFLSQNLFLQAGYRVIDIGCGSGYFAALFAAAVGPSGEIVALDIRQEAVGATGEVCEILGLRNVRCLRGPANNTGEPNESFDLAFLGHILSMNDKKSSLLAEAIRIIKPNGHLVFLEPRIKPPFQSFEPVSKDELITMLAPTTRFVLEREFDDNYLVSVFQKE